MDNHIKAILDELYAIDPALRDQEKELISLIEEMVRMRPDTQMDAQFVRTLRTRIMERAEQNKKPLSLITSLDTMKKIIYSLGGAVVAIAIIVPITYYSFNNRATQETDVALIPFKQEIKSLGTKSSFGRLLVSAGDATAGVSMKAAGLGGGGGGISAVAPSIASSESAPTNDASSTRMGIVPPGYPEVYEFKYVYDGADISIESAGLDVLKRIKTPVDTSGIRSMLSGFKFPGIDTKSFSNLKTKSIEVAQDEDFGLVLNAQFEEGVFSIYQNWTRWPHPESSCTDDACFRSYWMKIEQVLSNDQIITIANDFLSAHRIDRSIYGDPVVQDDWRAQYESTVNKQDAWIPDSLSVIYPLLINGRTTYDQSGTITGLIITVDMRQKKVSGVSNIMTQVFESSSYPLETDGKKLLSFAEKGGLTSPIYYMSGQPNAKTVEIKITTPKVTYMRYWRYDQKLGVSDELFVPTLVFPVDRTNVPTNGYYIPQNIMVPLVSELLDQPQFGGGPVGIMNKGVAEPATTVTPPVPTPVDTTPLVGAAEGSPRE